MSFTRSTTTTDVHQNMPDNPSLEGYTATQLKTAFDAPATGLKADINGLETELEASTAAASIGASNITYDDASNPNVQAKLEKIYSDLQAVTVGTIPDNSITEEKLATSLLNNIAKKDGTLQTNLNAEKLNGKAGSSYALKDGTLQTSLNAEELGGTTLAQLITRLSGYFTTGQITMTSNVSQPVGATINLGFIPSLIILTAPSGVNISGLGIIFSNKLVYLTTGENSEYHSLDVTVSNTGVVTIPRGMSRGTYNFIAFKSSL